MKRHSRERPCAICGGHPDLPRGRGLRCWGFVADDDEICHCTREEFSGALDPTRAGTFPHRRRCRCADGCTCAARGRRAPGCWCAERCSCCRCGVPHGEAPSLLWDHIQSARTDDRDRAAAALRIWRAALPLAGTIGEEYFRSRGITGALPPSLRFAPSLWHAPSSCRLAAIVGAVQDASGQVVAVHRTYLAAGPRRLDRRMLGFVRGGAVRLARAGEELALGEGIETMMSVHQAVGVPCWSALSWPGLVALELPPLPIASRVTIFADNDDAGEGLGAAYEAARRWAAEGRDARVAVPPRGTDANDVLRGYT